MRQETKQEAHSIYIVLDINVSLQDNLNILKSTLNDILIAHYQKPRIDVGNYYLKWNEEKNHGIQQNEIPEVKRFLKDAIPLFDASYEILNNLQKSIHKNKYDWNKELFPCLCLMHRNKDNVVSYELHMTTDGSTCLDRIEKIKVIDTNVENNEIDLSTSETSTGRSQHVKKSIIYLKWNLGELLFNRQGYNHQKNG